MYEAISWCWGNAEEEACIILNGRVVPVPVNAEYVLRRLCVDQGHTSVWLDAVSVNQSDNTERGHQVAMMCDVYSSAKRVLVWLGEADETTKSAVQSIDKLVAQCRKNICRQEDIVDYFSNAEGIFKYSDLALPSCDWPSISAFYESPWFTRLWVIQEVLLAKEALCFYGNIARPWSDVGLACEWMIHRNSWRYTVGLRYDGIHNASDMWECQYSPPSLLKLLDMSSRYKTTEPLDKVYGLFGLLQSSAEVKTMKNITPDYNKTIREVYTAATRAALEGSPVEVNRFSFS